MARSAARRPPAALPEWIRPQLTQLVQEAPEDPEWLHEIKFDGYRNHPYWSSNLRLALPEINGRRDSRITSQRIEKLGPQNICRLSFAMHR
jgi:hypothetical protein